MVYPRSNVGGSIGMQGQFCLHANKFKLNKKCLVAYCIFYVSNCLCFVIAVILLSCSLFQHAHNTETSTGSIKSCKNCDIVSEKAKCHDCTKSCMKSLYHSIMKDAFTASTLLVGHQELHPACKN